MSDEMSGGDRIVESLSFDIASWPVASPTPLPREIAPNIFWLGHCSVSGQGAGEVHGHLSCFLIRGGGASVLVDTGAPQGWPELSDHLDEILGGAPLDFIALTHPEIPHSGNVGNLLDKYKEAIAFGDTKDFHLYHPNDVDRFQDRPIGFELDLGGGYRYRVVESVIRDMPNTRWGFERKEGVLFVADGFSYTHYPALDEDFPVHRPGECGRLTTELTDFPTVEEVLDFSAAALYWTRFRDDADLVFGRLAELMRELPTSIIAPAHGNVIADPERVIPIVKEGHRRAFQDQEAKHPSSG